MREFSSVSGGTKSTIAGRCRAILK